MMTQDPILLLKIPMTSKRCYSTIIDNLGTRSQKGSPASTYGKQWDFS
jgi:hypothetical protein